MKRTLLSLTAIVLLAASCGKEGADGVDDSPMPEYITVEASVGAMTRATTTGNTTVFDQGDQISVYAWTDTQTETPQSFVVNNVANTLGQDNKWTPETPMLWKDMTTFHYFLGVYPARQIADFTADEFTLTAGDYEKSDLLYAVVLTGLKATDNPVSLTFDHAMAKLNVNMNFRSQWDATPTITSCVAKAANSCTINYLSKTVTPKADAAATVPLSALTVPTGDNFAAKYSTLIVPQTGFRTVTITIDGKEYTYTHPEDIPLTSGKYTTLNLIVGRNKIELGDISINDWIDGGTTIDGGEALGEGEVSGGNSTTTPVNTTTSEYYDKLTNYIPFPQASTYTTREDQQKLLYGMADGYSYNSTLTAEEAYALATYQAAIDGKPVYVIMSVKDGGNEVHYALSTDATAAEHIDYSDVLLYRGDGGPYDMDSEGLNLYYVEQ